MTAIVTRHDRTSAADFEDPAQAVSAGQVRIWRSEDGSCVQSLEGPSEGIEWLDWHPKGTVLLAGSQDFTVWMWNATSGACMQANPGLHHPRETTRLTCSSHTGLVQ